MQQSYDQTVVITGSATGIGKALARQMVREGGRMVICGRRPDRVEEAVAELKKQDLARLSPGLGCGGDLDEV